MIDRKMSDRIAVLSFLATCVVALFHFGDGSIAPYNAVDEHINQIINSAFSSLVELALGWFFLLSGFFAFREYNLKHYISKVRKRFFTLMIPYILWNLIFGFSYYILRGEFRGLFRLMFYFADFPPDVPLWYVYVVFCLVILSPILFFLLKNKQVGAIVLFLIYIAIYYLSELEEGAPTVVIKWGYVRNILWYLPSFLAGAYMGLHYDSDQDRFERDTIKMMAVFGVATSVANVALGGLFASYSKRILLPVIMLFFFPALSALRNIIPVKLTFLLYSVHFYLVHQDFTIKLDSFLNKAIPFASVNNLIGRLISYLVVLAACLVIWVSLSLFVPVLLRILTGGRTEPLVFKSNEASS